MDNTFGVNVVQGRADACNVERNVAFLEHIALAKVITQVATGLQIQHEETMLSVKEKRSKKHLGKCRRTRPLTCLEMQNAD